MKPRHNIIDCIICLHTIKCQYTYIYMYMQANNTKKNTHKFRFVIFINNGSKKYINNQSIRNFTYMPKPIRQVTHNISLCIVRYPVRHD